MTDMSLKYVMTCLIVEKTQTLIFQLSLNILYAKLLIYSVFIDKSRSSHYFIQIIQSIFHNKRRSSHCFHPNHTKIALSRSPPKYYSMFCTRNNHDNNAATMES
jgi:hypothetical protein